MKLWRLAVSMVWPLLFVWLGALMVIEHFL